ncbi:Alpha/Beta hydrolase protein [Podospora aff. communis PSN243]|uniref:Carboxylic ester hydrolase n=1 Tax=Podospora aff. communis PSN243 TaxID=3040156 RepID=A0AAV9GNP3_9PEZI|nr:Alpha/Beta hydrolase protein [Podospora aff. communis PSN243]
MQISKTFLAGWLVLVSSVTATSGSARRGHLHEERDAACGTTPPTVTVLNGTYAGVCNAHYKQDFFLGIPYAQKPVRFTVAEPLNSTWNGTRDATAYGPHCVGFGPDMIGYEMSEDCLHINVIRPAGVDPSAQLPVAVWIHGGGLTMGGSADKRYNLTFIVERSVEVGTPIIAVSFNYRMATFGFLSGEEVQAAGATNLGFRDQRHALRWIQENIAAFGGAPDKVTLWGESAGAISINAQLFAYHGRDDHLFRAAVAQSGFGGALMRFPGGLNNTAIPSAAYARLLAATSCTDLPCLRALPLSTLIPILSNRTLDVAIWLPALDGDFIADYPSNQLRLGHFPRIPILAGQNTDEGASFGANRSATNTPLNTPAELADAVARILFGTSHPNLPTLSRELLTLYPDIQAIGIPAISPEFPLLTPSTPELPLLGLQYRRSCAIFGDWMQSYQLRRGVTAWSNYNVPAYNYRFDITNVGVPGYLGAAHFQEIPYTFYNLDGVGYARNPFDGAPAGHVRVAREMADAWVRFFVGMDPNPSLGPSGKGKGKGKGTGEEEGEMVEWPRYDAAEGGGVGRNLVFDAAGSWVEWDSWRAEGIQWMIENSLEGFGS